MSPPQPHRVLLICESLGLGVAIVAGYAPAGASAAVPGMEYTPRARAQRRWAMGNATDSARQPDGARSNGESRRRVRRVWVLALAGACGGVQKDTGGSLHSVTMDTADTSGTDSVETPAESETSSETDTSDTSVETAEPRCIGSGPWVSVSAGYDGSCGIHEDGCIECWTAIDTGPPVHEVNDTGYHGRTGELVPPDGSYSAVDLGRCNGWGTHGCAIRQSDGGIECWGSDAWRAASPPPGPWSALGIDEDNSCALGPDGGIACWGRFIGAGDHASHSLSTDYVALSNCRWTVCGLAIDGRVDCWEVGEEDDIHLNPGPWIAMTNISNLVLGVTPDGGISTNAGTWSAPKSSAPAANLCVSAYSCGACVLDVNGAVVCSDALRDAPDAAFTSISCGATHACGVTMDGDLLCWGDCNVGQCDVPMHE